MPVENPSAHDPALNQSHAAGVKPETASPAERALAPEANEPMQSANGIADDGTYVGQGGGYLGASSPGIDHDTAPRVDKANERGDGAYGFPSGPGVGTPGGEHRPIVQKPDVIPNPYPER